MTTPTPTQIEAIPDAWAEAYRQGFEDCSNGRCDKYAAITAAAEAGLPVDLMIKDAVDAAIAATIKRCARVAQSMYGAEGEEIATAIRAMKDKP